MKALIYLVGLIAVAVLVIWFVWDITPQNQWAWVERTASEVTSGTEKQGSDVTASAEKLGSRVGARFSEAADVFHGEDVNAKRFDELTKNAQ
jgi:Flp pilus assembly protein CpaB